MFEFLLFSYVHYILYLSVPVTLLFWYMGILNKIVPTISTFGPQAILYRDYQGGYDRNLGPQFHEICQIAMSVKHIKSISSSFGLYFDRPRDHPDPQKLRAILGFFISPTNASDSTVAKFLNENKDFKFALLPQFQTISVAFPYRNFLSYTLAMWKTLSPLFAEYDQLKRKNNKLETVGVLEIDDPIGRKQIYVHVPFGENIIRQFPTSFYPEPPRKTSQKRQE